MPPKPSKVQPALVGGAVIGFISAVPFLNFINCFCCVGVLLGGFLAVMLYKNNITPGMAPLTSNDALALGAFAGLFGAVIGTVLSAIIMALFGNVAGEMFYDLVVKFYQNAGIEVPEEFYDELRQALLKESLGIAWMFLSLFFGIIVDSIFGLLGGLLGYAVFKPKTPPVPTVPPTTPSV